MKTTRHDSWTQRVEILGNQDLVFPGVPPDVPVLRWKKDGLNVTNEVRLVASGDLGLSGRLGKSAKNSGATQMLSEIAPALKSADLAFANLESAFVSDWDEEKMFAGEVRHIQALADSGFSVFHMASNHQLDHGVEAFGETVSAVKAAGITPLGVGCNLDAARALTRTDRRGMKIGWIAAGRTQVPQDGRGTCYYELNPSEFVETAKQARNSVDFLIASLHLGTMNMDHPDPRHRHLCEQLAKVPADLILMHHAHLIQGMQWFDKTPVFYSLGNFMWDHAEGALQKMRGWKYKHVEEQITGILFCIDISKDGVSQILASPFLNDNCERLLWLRGDRGYAVLKRFLRLSLETEEDIKSSKFFNQYVERVSPDFLILAKKMWAKRNLNGLLEMAGKVRPRHLIAMSRWVRNRIIQKKKQEISA